MVFAAILEGIYQLFVGPIVLEEDNFTTMVRKIIAVIFGIATLFGGGSPYYGYRAFIATNSTNPEDVPYQPALIVLAATLFVFAFVMCLPVGLYVYCTKSAPDWILQYCIVMTIITTVMWDISTVYFPIRATSLGLAFVSIGSSLPQSKLIVVLLAIYYLLVEARDAWDISQLRIQPPYEGGPIERFVTSMTGFFSLVMCCGLMGGMLFQYTVLLDGAAQAIELTKSVAQNLLNYDTDMVAEELKAFEIQNGLVVQQQDQDQVTLRDEDGNVVIRPKTDEGGNKRNQELVEVFREMANNLVRFRPHLPDYVLKVQEDDDSNEFENNDSAAFGSTPSSQNMSPFRSGAGPMARYKGHHRSADDEEMSEGNLSFSTTTDSESKNGGGANSGVMGASFSTDPHSSGPPSRRASVLNSQMLAQVSAKYLQQQQAQNISGVLDNASVALSFAGGNNNTRRQLASKTQRTQAMFSGMLKGAQHENVIVARLDFEKFVTMLLDGGLESEVLSPKVNALVAKILDTAFAVDGTAHSFFEDSLIVSWNATRRANQPEYKCCKFLVEIKSYVNQTVKAILSGTTASASPGSFSSPTKEGGNTTSKQQPTSPLMRDNTTPSFTHDEGSPGSPTSSSAAAAAAAASASASPTLGQTGSNNFSFSSFNHNASILTVAAVSGTAWCQISGSEKRQIFSLFKFSSSETLKKMAEYARKNGFIAIDQQIQARARVEFQIQGCGTISVPKPENNIFFDQQQQRLQQQNNYTKGIMQNAKRLHRRKSTVTSIKSPGPSTIVAVGNNNNTSGHNNNNALFSITIPPPENNMNQPGTGIYGSVNATSNSSFGGSTNNNNASSVQERGSGSTSTGGNNNNTGGGFPVSPPLLPHQNPSSVVVVEGVESNPGLNMANNSNINTNGTSSPSSSDKHLNAVPPPIERRNTAMFKKDFGWTSEAEKQEEDTGRMVLSPDGSTTYLATTSSPKDAINNNVSNNVSNNNGSRQQTPEPLVNGSTNNGGTTPTKVSSFGNSMKQPNRHSQNHLPPQTQTEEDAVLMGNVDSSSTSTTTNNVNGNNINNVNANSISQRNASNINNIPSSQHQLNPHNQNGTITSSANSCSVSPSEFGGGLVISSRNKGSNNSNQLAESNVTNSNSNHNNNNNNQNNVQNTLSAMIGAGAAGGMTPKSVGSVDLDNQNSNRVQQPNALTPINPIRHHHHTHGTSSIASANAVGGIHSQSSGIGIGGNSGGIGNNNNAQQHQSTPNKNSHSALAAASDLNTSNVISGTVNVSHKDGSQVLPQGLLLQQPGGYILQAAVANQQNMYKNTFLVSVYELVSWKINSASSGEDDEWLYQVQDKDMLNGNLSDATNYLTKGQSQAAEAVLNKVRQEMPDVEFSCQAFRSIVECVEEMKLRQKVLNHMQQPQQ